MGKIIIHEETTKNPISLIGEMAGICWGADISNKEKNYQRGLDCLNSNHGRTFEYPQIFMTLDGYSARVIREFYTHIGGGPTRLQASTRYIDYGNFDYITPPSIAKDKICKDHYEYCMFSISEMIKDLEAWGCPKEDVANLLPLGMTTKVVVRTNARNLIDMSHQRKCNRAYWEFRQLFSDLEKTLKSISKEWEYLIDNYFKPKCEILGHCPEKNKCGKM